jgi:hypothetical protein
LIGLEFAILHPTNWDITIPHMWGLRNAGACPVLLFSTRACRDKTAGQPPGVPQSEGSAVHKATSPLRRMDASILLLDTARGLAIHGPRMAGVPRRAVAEWREDHGN